MKILAIETSSERGSVALWLDGVLSETLLTGSGSGHSASVLPAIRGLWRDAGLSASDMDVMAFGAGPGAFTGVRLACSIAQGLALGADRPVAMIDSLAALAEPACSGPIYCAMDARMSEIYVAGFERMADGSLCCVQPAQCVAPDEAPLPLHPAGLGLGTAFRAYPALVARLAASFSAIEANAAPTAAAVARLAAAQSAHWCDAALAAPTYVRDRVAQTIAERLAQGGRA